MSATASPPAPVALVVEDEPLILFETVDLLADRGFTVLDAFNAAQALQRLRDHPEVTLMVTDVQMPGAMQGFALAREAHRLYPGLSIVVCSGVAQPESGELPVLALFIDKPLSAKVLGETLGLLGHA